MATTTVHNYGSEQQWLVTLSFPNGEVAGDIIFDRFAGGDVSAPVIKHRPGGMKSEITYLSLKSYSDITLTKVYETQADHARVGTLHSLVGKALVTVTMTPLDDAGNPWSATPPTANAGAQGAIGAQAAAGDAAPAAAVRSYTGRLVAVKDGGTDSMSNAARMLEVDVAVEDVQG